MQLSQKTKPAQDKPFLPIRMATNFSLRMQVRDNSKAETNATLVLRLKLEQVSAKVRTGFPKDDEKDYQLTDVWAGILPFAPLQTLKPIDDHRLLKGISLPKSVANYKRPVQ